MKSRYIVLALIFSAGVILTLTSCRTRYIPTSVLIATDTPTNTPLNTATPTLTPSHTPTRTSTPTPTITNTLVPTNTHTPTITLTPVGPTNTFTDTLTFTNTPTITPTFTNTETPTITNTPLPTSTPTVTSTTTATSTVTDTPSGPTITPTATLCPAIFQTTYNFNSSTECWHGDGGTTIVKDVSLSTAQVHTGSTNSLAVSINNTSAVTQSAQVEITYATNQSVASATLSLWIYVESSLKTLPDWNLAVQPFAQDPWTANWIAVNSASSIIPNNWYNAAVTFGSGVTNIYQLGVQISGVGPGASGNVYIDGVSITFPAGPTATPTATATAITSISYYFDSGSISSWQVSGNSVTVGATPTVYSPGYSSPLVIFSPGFGGSAGCLSSSITFNQLNETVNYSYVYSTPLDVTGYNVTGMRAQVQTTAALSNNPTGSFIFVKSGSGWSWQNSSWTNVTPGSWTQLNFTSAISSPATIQEVGVQFASGGGGTTYVPGSAYVDSFEFY